MVMATRASVRRNRASPPTNHSGGAPTNTRLPNNQPNNTLRQWKRSRSSAVSLSVGSSDAQARDGQASSNLTWQQQELLRHPKATRSVFKAAPLSAGLPILRVTRDCEFVLAVASEAPKQSGKARRSLPTPPSLFKASKRLSCSSGSAKRCRSSDRFTGLRPPTANPPQAYAEPSCFRAPMPQSLPPPCFSKSINSIALTPNATFT